MNYVNCGQFVIDAASIVVRGLRSYPANRWSQERREVVAYNVSYFIFPLGSCPLSMEVILHKLKMHNGFFFPFFSFFHLGGWMKGRVVDLVARWDWQQRGATNPRKQNPECKEPMKLNSKRGGKRSGLGEDRYEDVPNMVLEIWSSNKNLIIIIIIFYK